MTTKSAKQSAKKSPNKKKINRSFVAPLNTANNDKPKVAEVKNVDTAPKSDALMLPVDQVPVVSIVEVSEAVTEENLVAVDIERVWVSLAPQSAWAKHQEAWLMHAAECSINHTERGIHPNCGVWAWIPEHGTVLLQTEDYQMLH